MWLGAFDPKGEHAVKTQARLFPSTPPSHITTLTIGSVLLQVFTTDFVLAEAQSLPEYVDEPPWPYSEALIRIWPVVQPVVHWPPSSHVTPDVFDKVASWGQTPTIPTPPTS